MGVSNSTVMEDCPHVRTMRVGQHTTLLNPRNWACVDCGTTESVWVRTRHIIIVLSLAFRVNLAS